jgi:hypothetical protein
VEFAVEAADHFKRKTLLLGENFLNSPPPSEHRLEVLARHAGLIHPEFDGFDRTRRINDMVPCIH